MTASVDRDRVLAAAYQAGRKAARLRARGARVQAPHVLAGSLLMRQAASQWHSGFAGAGGDTARPGTAVKLQRVVDLNGQETVRDARDDDEGGYAAGGGAAQHRPHDAYGAEYIPGGTPGATAGGEPPRRDFTAPVPRVASAPDDEDDADYPDARGTPPRPGRDWPAPYMDGYWPSGGHGTQQPGTSSPGGSNGRPPNGVGKSAASPKAVYDLMAASFPPHAIAWVLDARWTGPQEIPADRVDTGDENSWAAHRQPDRVAHFAAGYEAGHDVKPGITVQPQGSATVKIVDGHHRFLGAQEARKPWTAYIGHPPPGDDRWQETHAYQQHGSGPSNKTAKGTVAAGLAVRAAETGRILMIQRAVTEDDPAAGMWEFPGGHIEPGETPLQAALREWGEETGCQPPKGNLTGHWEASNGVYEGFVLEVPAEQDVPVFEGRDQVWNPDDPDGDMTEALAWWDPALLRGNPAVRAELAGDLDRVYAALAGTAAKADGHGNAQTLRDYWTGHGHGGPTRHAFEHAIAWGTPGDFDRCVAMVTEHGKMSPGQAKGYCNLRHHEALGYWPAQHAEMDRGKLADPGVVKVGPKGYIHGWIFVGVPGVGDEVHHPHHGPGTVTHDDGTHVTVAFGDGSRKFEATRRDAAEAPRLEPRTKAKLPSADGLLDRLSRESGPEPGTRDDPELTAVGRGFEGTFGGLRARVTSAVFDPHWKMVRIRGAVLDKDGNGVGTFERVLKHSRSTRSGLSEADHDYLALQPQVQGRGFASGFNQHAEDSVYRPMGIGAVTVHADIDVGGYTWARQGFDWADREEAEGMLPRIAREAEGSPEAEADLDAIRERMTGSLRDPGYPTPREFSEIGKRPGSTMWAGKSGMLGSDWYGVKYLGEGPA